MVSSSTLQFLSFWHVVKENTNVPKIGGEDVSAGEIRGQKQILLVSLTKWALL